jgi:hypothetical protein
MLELTILGRCLAGHLEGLPAREFASEVDRWLDIVLFERDRGGNHGDNVDEW